MNSADWNNILKRKVQEKEYRLFKSRIKVHRAAQTTTHVPGPAFKVYASLRARAHTQAES
jgi:hypothetical protein